MVKVENLKAVQGGEAVEIQYLGCLLWSTVSDVLKIPTGDLKQALTEVGLEKFMPRKINPRDAFRRVTKSFEVRREPYGKDTYINLLVRDVRHESGQIVRQIVREIVDGENIRLDYKPVIQLAIDKEGNLSITPLINDLTLSEREIAARLPQLQEEALNHYDGTHIRYMLRMILEQCSPVSVRPNGGVDFVPQKYVDTVEAVKTLSKHLNEYSGNVKMWSIPVIDAHEHREMLEESLEEQVINGSASLIQEMKAILEDPSREPTAKSAKSFADRVRKLKDLVSEYEDLLETQSTKARANLELARLQAVKLMELVPAEED